MDSWRAAKNKDLETETDSMDDAEVPDEQIEPISVSNKSKSVQSMNSVSSKKEFLFNH